MNARMISRQVIALGLCLGLFSLFVPTASFAASLAFDKASDPAYSSGWTNGSNGGVGWGTNSWQLFVADNQTNIPAATFISSSTNNNASGDTNLDGDIDTAGVSWGMLGAGPAGTQDVGAIRFFNGSLTNGQRFVVFMDNGFVPPDQFVDFFLHNTNDEVRFLFRATNQTYLIQGAVGDIDTGISAIPTGITNTDEGLKIEVQVVNVDTVNVFVTKLVTGTQSVFSNVPLGILGIHTPEIQGVSFINNGTGSGATNTLFFNSIQILPDPADTNLFADLAIDKTVSPSPAFTGSNFTYVVTVTNNGPSDATAVTVTDVPPAGITFVTTPSQGSCTNIGGQIICDLGILTNTGIASITLVGTPASAGSITNTAVVTALNVDPNPTNNVITNSVSVIAPAVLSVTPANHDFGSVATGTTVQTTFVVTNSGSATLNGTATLAIPQFTIASGSPFSIPALGTTNVVVDFTPDSAATFTDNVIFASNGGASTNQVTGTGTITTPPLLTVTPSDLDFGTLAVGETSTLSFSVINDGIDTLSGTSTVSGVGFALVSGSTFDVSAGQTGTVDVTFSPGIAAAFTGSVVFTSNGGVSTNGLTGAATNAFPGPVAVFTASPNNGAPPLIVTFTDHSTVVITHRLWNFGDGDISTSANPTHVYTNASSFTVSLTVRGPGGSNTVSHLVVVTGVAKNSPVGDWEIKVSGADKGIAFLTLSNNATATGYEIRMKTFGLDTLSGTWGLDAKGKLTGAFGEKLGGATNWTGTLAGTAKTDKSISGKVTAIPAGFFNWKGIPATTFPDLSGTWSGQVAIAKTANINVAYKITMNATNSGVFDVAAATATNTVIGQFIVTSKDAINCYLTVSSNQTTLSGKFKDKGSKGETISLKGNILDSKDKVNLNLIKQ